MPLNVVTQAMGEVHTSGRCTTCRPCCDGARAVANPVESKRVAQPDVGRSHVDLRPQRPLYRRGKLAVLHARETDPGLSSMERLRYGLSIAGLCRARPRYAFRFLGREIANVGLAQL